MSPIGKHGTFVLRRLMLLICAGFNLWNRFGNSPRSGEKYRVLPYRQMEMMSNAISNRPCPYAKDGYVVPFGDEHTWAGLH